MSNTLSAPTTSTQRLPDRHETLLHICLAPCIPERQPGIARQRRRRASRIVSCACPWMCLCDVSAAHAAILTLCSGRQHTPKRRSMAALVCRPKTRRKGETSTSHTSGLCRACLCLLQSCGFAAACTHCNCSLVASLGCMVNGVRTCLRPSEPLVSGAFTGMTLRWG